jgi:hypothetical protein
MSGSEARTCLDIPYNLVVMAPSGPMPSAGFATRLREELSFRSREYARRLKLPMCESYGQAPVVCYEPSGDGFAHGNFLRGSYRAILKDESWSRRLDKVHTQARSSLPSRDRRWRELDSCNSSDALLMNVFCFPGTLKPKRLFDLLGVQLGARPLFGFKARVPFANGRVDRTEVDMQLGDLLVEAKLTESDFQSREVAAVEAYRDFDEVFDVRSLPQADGQYLSYQLIRNVLAAHAGACSFCVMADERRPDLREYWYRVMRCIRSAELRVRCKMITWQELAEVLPPKLQKFLDAKYGIAARTIQTRHAGNF